MPLDDARRRDGRGASTSRSQCRYGYRLQTLRLPSVSTYVTVRRPNFRRSAASMDWTADLEITSKKLIPRLGRRAGQQSNFQEELKSDDDLLDSPASWSSGKNVTGQQPPVVPPRTRKTGWGDDLKSGKVRGVSSIIEQERLRPPEKEEKTDDIPVIPDLDEIQEDNILSDVTNAPVLNANRVTAYKELDTDLIKNAAFTSLNGVNLSLLAEKLYNENLVKEPDEVWNWNLLFTQVASDINSETQKKIVA